MVKFIKLATSAEFHQTIHVKVLHITNKANEDEFNLNKLVRAPAAVLSLAVVVPPRQLSCVVFPGSVLHGLKDSTLKNWSA